MTDIKFCGLTREADAAFASSLGAGFIGAIFAGGPRELTPERAAEVFGAAGRTTKRVGVFGADFRSRVPVTAGVAELDVIQLHGDPIGDDVRTARELFPGIVWAVVRMAGSTLPQRTAELFAVADAVLFDSSVAGRLGGTGTALDWVTLGSAISHSRGMDSRVILAGGLAPGNVANAIEAVRPSIVDVSSGVESAPGVKDHARMSAFAEAVRRSSR